MTKCRFLYENEISDADQIAVSSVFYGTIGGIYAEQLGSAVVETGGSFTASGDLGYVVEIDSVAAGKEVGQATFKWSDDDGQTWDGTAIATQAAPYTLNNGVTVKFATGTGDDFELADKWSFICKNNYGSQKMFDLDRDFFYRSRTLDDPNTITLTFASAKNIKAIVLLDHNLTSAAVITLMGHTSDAWGSPAYSQVVTWTDEKTAMYLDQTYRYWRIQISDQLNTAGYIEVAEVYLGDYFEPGKNYSYNWSQKTKAFETVQKSPAGAGKRFLNYLQEVFDIAFKNLSSAESTAFVTMYETVKNAADGSSSPVFFNTDSADPDDIYLVHLPAAITRKNTYNGRYSLSMMLEEEIKSNV